MNFNGFRPLKKINGGEVEHEQIVIANSVTMTQGMAVKKIATGVDVADANTDNIYGYCIGFVDQDGMTYQLRTTEFTGGTGDSYTEASTGDTYVSGSDNTTVKKIAAVIVPAKDVICSALLDAAKGTTTGSNKCNYYLDVVTGTASQLDESSASGTKAQFITVPGISPSDPTDPQNPESTTRILVKAVEVQDVQPQ